MIRTKDFNTFLGPINSNKGEESASSEVLNPPVMGKEDNFVKSLHIPRASFPRGPESLVISSPRTLLHPTASSGCVENGLALSHVPGNNSQFPARAPVSIFSDIETAPFAMVLPSLVASQSQVLPLTQIPPVFPGVVSRDEADEIGAVNVGNTIAENSQDSAQNDTNPWTSEYCYQVGPLLHNWSTILEHVVSDMTLPLFPLPRAKNATRVHEPAHKSRVFRRWVRSDRGQKENRVGKPETTESTVP